jgi:hypothetical protein
MEKEIKIAQTSFPRSGSTILCNVLYGLFSPSLPVIFSSRPNRNRLIYKSHMPKDRLNLSVLDNEEYDIFMIMSERDRKYPDEFRSHEKVLIFPYEDLVAKDQYCPHSEHSLEWVVSNIYEKSISFLPSCLFTRKSEMIKNALRRINDMNKLHEEIKDKPFTFRDEFYHLHGSHRGMYHFILDSVSNQTKL